MTLLQSCSLITKGTGDYCQVYIEFTGDPTTAAECAFGASLPFASEISTDGEVVGSGCVTTASGAVETVAVANDNVNNRANVVSTATGTISRNYRISFFV